MANNPAIIETWQFEAFFCTMTLIFILIFCATVWSLLFEKWPSIVNRIGAAITVLPASGYMAWTMTYYSQNFWK